MLNARQLRGARAQEAGALDTQLCVDERRRRTDAAGAPGGRGPRRGGGARFRSGGAHWSSTGVATSSQVAGTTDVTEWIGQLALTAKKSWQSAGAALVQPQVPYFGFASQKGRHVSGQSERICSRMPAREDVQKFVVNAQLADAS